MAPEGVGLRPHHRARLCEVGVPEEILARLDLRLVEQGLPAWWSQRGNALYVEHGFPAPGRLVASMTAHEVDDALIVFGSDLSRSDRLELGGDRATVFVGLDSYLGDAHIYCGADSAIVLQEHCTTTHSPWIDARNGGSIVAEPDQLWALGVVVTTDDMHRLEDLATGSRLNPYGGQIRLGRHVWIGREAVVTGHSRVDADSVVGMRSVVRNKTFPPNVAIAGSPAKVIREGVTWTREDRPDVSPDPGPVVAPAPSPAATMSMSGGGVDA